MQNYFEFFALPEQFAVDLPQLEKAYKEIQKLVHPDRFVTATEAEKRSAMQWATMANDGYQILKNPVRRGAYLCEMHGHNVKQETHVSMSPEFLMQQMEWREQLQQAKSSGDRLLLESLSNDCRAVYENQLQATDEAFGKKDFDAAADSIRKLMFLDRFRAEISKTLDETERKN